MNNSLVTVNGSSTKAKSLYEWLLFAIGNADYTKPDGTLSTCVGLSLSHVNGPIEKEIHGLRFAGQKYDEAKVRQLAEMFDGLAHTDAQSLSGSQRYVLYAFYDGFDQPKARFNLVVNGHLVNKPGDFSTEPATPEGRLAQRMRHDEAYSQTLIAANANTLNIQNNLLRLMAERLDQTTREHRDMFEFVHTLVLERAREDREHEIRMLEYQRNTQIMSGLTKVAPAMINTITGKEVVPQSTVDTQILETIAENLDESSMAQLAPLLSKFPPEMVGVLMSRFEQITKAKQEEKERLGKTLAKANLSHTARAELSTGEDER